MTPRKDASQAMLDDFERWAKAKYLHGSIKDVAQAGWLAAVARSPQLHDDPVIDGLFKILPPPGSVWPESERQTWLLIAERSIARAYAQKAEPPLLVLSPRLDDDEPEAAPAPNHPIPVTAPYMGEHGDE